MCGIVGYTGRRKAAPILLEGLSKLEYRGYDSAGIAVRCGENEPEVIKSKGKLKMLSNMTNCGENVEGNCGIGHTRWATHGEPSVTNAHPHCSDNKNIIGVHNGIIENYTELREKLTKEGYSFVSETDTEVMIKLTDYYYKKYGSGPVDALARTMMRVRGSYAICMLFKDYPSEIYVARKDSPLIIGTAEDGGYIASDVPAILKYTKNVYYLGNSEIARVRPNDITFFNVDREEITLELSEIKWSASSAEKNGFEHFLLKEIHEQPDAVKNTLASLVNGDRIDLSLSGITPKELAAVSNFYIVACGSAYNVGLTMQYMLEGLTSVSARVELASEFRYRKMNYNSGSIVVIISQSGETADSLAALREAKNQGIKTLGIVNVVGSSIAREADHVIYTHAGPEISVATTKAYSAQLIAGYALILSTALSKGEITEERCGEFLEEIRSIPEKIENILSSKEDIQHFANRLAGTKNMFFIGRNCDHATSLEGSLKLKELSYIHSEAYPAGELKHGPISLIEEGTPVIGIMTQPELYEKMASNLIEVGSRGADVTAITVFGQYNAEKIANTIFYIPKISSYLAGSLAVVPMQLLAYYVSVAKGYDVDKPRNLAKSVTVE